ncbi:MAG TPA: AI-2E family transporter [Nocardioidaceae bacterium]|nr:AI-2E family transporter [Nocardioidaceae bacterium]
MTRPPPWLKRAVVFTLLAGAVFLLSLWLLDQLKGFLGLVFLAWLLSISFEPVVSRLATRGMRRGLATGLVMVGLAVLALVFLGLFGALLVDQLSQLVAAVPDVVRGAVDWANGVFGTSFEPADIADSLRLSPERIEQLAEQLAPGVVGVVSALLGFVVQALTLMLFAYYMSAQGPQLRRTVSSWFPPRQQRVISTVWEIAVEKTGGWVVSSLLLATLSAFLTSVFLWLLGVPYWLPLGIWTGVVSQFIPAVGAYLGVVLPALVALSVNPFDALWVVLFGIVYQQIENLVFAPRITARTVNIHPAVAFGSVIVGATLFGPLGALVAIPVVAAIQAVVETYGRRYELVAVDEAEGGTTPAAS